MFERQTDVVEAFKQALLAKRIDVEGRVEPRAVHHRLGFQVDRQSASVRLIRPLEEFLDLGLRQADGEHSVLEAIVEENVGERRRDHDAKAEIGQRPRGVFSRGAATEVRPSQKDRCISERFSIEDEIWVFTALRVEAPIVKEEVAEARPLDPFEELLRNNGVGVDVDSVQRSDQAFMADERLHNNPPGDSP
jgi:hypothetical protein